jgi:hypothetical protein
MAIHYRVRPGFRLAAVVPALLLTSLGVAFLVLALLNVVSGELFALVAVVLGVAGTALGLLLARVAWSGRVPASVEEYGLDDASEVQAHREEARTRGPLDE